MEDSTQGWTQLGPFFPKSGPFFRFSKKGRGGLLSLLPSCARDLILQIFVNNKKGYVISLYQSPSQTPDEFDSFIKNLKKLIIDIYSRKADFVLMIGDFNVKSSNWSTNDTTTPEGAQLDFIISSYGMK